MKRNKPRGVILVLALALVVFLSGLLGMLVINASQLSRYIKDNLELTVFFENDMSDENSKILSDSFTHFPYVNKIIFVGKEEAVFKFKEEIGEDFVDILGENPLSAYTTLSIKPRFTNAPSLSKINSDLRETEGVLEVSYPQNVFHQIDRNRQVLSVWMTSLSVVFGLVAIFLIASTIKLLLYSDRFIIKNKQLVGARDRFIRKPYLIQSIWWSLSSFVFGVLLLWSMLWLVFVKLDRTIGLNIGDISKHFEQNWFQYFLMLLLLLIINLVVVTITTQLTVRKYLNTSTDNLY